MLLKNSLLVVLLTAGCWGGCRCCCRSWRSGSCRCSPCGTAGSSCSAVWKCFASAPTTYGNILIDALLHLLSRVVALYLGDLDVKEPVGSGDAVVEGEGEAGGVASVGANVYVHWRGETKIWAKQATCIFSPFLLCCPAFSPHMTGIFIPVETWCRKRGKTAIRTRLLAKSYACCTVVVNVSRQSPSLSLALPLVPTMVKDSKSRRSMHTSVFK